MLLAVSQFVPANFRIALQHHLVEKIPICNEFEFSLSKVKT